MRATGIKNGMVGFHALQEQCITNTKGSPYWLLCCENIVWSSFVILNLRDLSQFALPLVHHMCPARNIASTISTQHHELQYFVHTWKESLMEL